MTLWVRSQYRRRWAALVTLAVLIALGGGVTVAAAAAARRTDTAFDRMLEQAHEPELWVSSLGEEGFGDLDPVLLDRVMNIEGVTGLWALAFVAVAPAEYPNFFAIAVIDERGDAPRLTGIEGPSRINIDEVAADEVLLNESMRDQLGKGVGDTVELQSATTEQYVASLAGDEGLGQPLGPTFTARIVGVGRSPEDVSDAPDPFLLLSPDFYERYQDTIWNCRCTVAVNAEPPAVDHVAAELAKIYPGAIVEPTEDLAVRVDDTIALQRRAWWSIAFAAALAAVIALALASIRFVRVMVVEDGTHRALGMTSADRRLGRFLVLAPAAVGGALGTAAIAYALSPLAPVGIAGRAEPDPGLRWDAAAIGSGVGAVLVASLLVAALASVVVRRRTGRIERTSGLGGPVGTLGTRLAFGPGRGVLGGVLVGAAGLVGAFTVDRSIDHVLSTPALYGADFDASVFAAELADRQVVAAALASDTDIAAVAFVWAERLGDDGTPPQAVGPGGTAYVEPHALENTKGAVVVQTIEGRGPLRADEVAPGRVVLDALDAGIGDRITVTGTGVPQQMTIVGVAIDPGVDSAGTGFMVTYDGLATLVEPAISGTVVQFAAGADPAAVIERHADLALAPVEPPSEVGNIGELGGLPGRVGQLFALLGIAALLNAVTLVGAQGRRTVAIYRALGFTSAQVIGAHLWLAAIASVLGGATGGLAGFLAGRTIARELIGNVGAIAETVVPAEVWMVGAGVLAVGAVVGAVTGVLALRNRAGAALRTE